MSSAFYPLGMNSSSNHLPQGGYKTWKGTGIYENPTSVTSKNIRPLTNKDYGNVFPTGAPAAVQSPVQHPARSAARIGGAPTAAGRSGPARNPIAR